MSKKKTMVTNRFLRMIWNFIYMEEPMQVARFFEICCLIFYIIFTQYIDGTV